MRLLLSYTLGNLVARRLTTSLAVLGMALVVFVFAAVLMLAYGLEKTLVDTGSEENIIVTRAGSTAETVSILGRDQAGVVTTEAEVAVEADGTPIAAKEIVVLIAAERRGKPEEANVVIRGTGLEAVRFRSGVKIVEGRMFAPGASELIAGRSTAKNFKGCGIGESLRFAEREWTVVGIFDAGGTGFDSELWGDAEQVQQAFRRPIYSSVTARLRDMSSFAEMKKRLEADPRLTVDVEREIEHYANQSRATATFIRVIGLVVTIIFSLGAVLGAMITMYAAVANRTSEIGTLRALGFSRRTVLGVFLGEALFLGLLGGAIGVAGASLLSFITVSTTNWDTFSELAFGFELSPGIAISSLLFALGMGVVGGFLPAVRASRARIVESLRAA